MRRNSPLLLLLFVPQLANAQAWMPCGLTSVPFEPNTALCVHQGKLYEHNSLGLKKSVDGATWVDVPVDGLFGSITHLVSTGDRLYAGTFENFSTSSAIYWSTDEGATWNMDTVGLPEHALNPGYKAAIQQLHAFDGHLYAELDYMESYYTKSQTDASWAASDWLLTNDPGTYNHSGDTLLTCSKGSDSHGFAWSDDHGATWHTPACTGLPAGWGGQQIAYDAGTGRLYTAGLDWALMQRQLYRSDDFGATWDLMPLPIANNGQFNAQNFGPLHASAGALFVSLSNSQDNTAPDLMLSTDGAATFAKDTVGLPNDPYSTLYVSHFVEHNGELFILVNANDVFHRGFGTTAVTEVPAGVTGIQAYPVPCRGPLHVTAAGLGERCLFSLHDARGRTVRTGTLLNGRTLQLTGLQAGHYTLTMRDATGRTARTAVMMVD